MPVWHEKTRAWRESGRLIVVGITQEQHPERCRLFAQWQGIDWPILWDPFNLTGSRVVPSFVGVDEHGVVRAARVDLESFEADFLECEFAAPDPPAPAAASPGPAEPGGRSLVQLLRGGATDADREVWGAISELCWSGGGGDERLHERALAALERASTRDPDDAALRFRLGVARRMRHDSPHARRGDFQDALDAWGEALSKRPDQYIWRRRLQQYGPRLDKPYPFYGWVDEARAAVTARGEVPVALLAPLTTSERIDPERSAAPPAGEAPEETSSAPDPTRGLPRDGGLVQLETALAPGTAGQTGAVRVHLILRPSQARRAHWDDGAGPLQVWIEDPPEGVAVDRRLLTAPPLTDPRGRRELDLEVRLAARPERPLALRGYAVYGACEDVVGVCSYLRQEFEVRLR